VKKTKRNGFALWFSALGLAAVGFTAGWLANGRLLFSNEAVVEASVIHEKGDAPEDIHAEVMDVMRSFQEGYTNRDVRALDGFMQQLFPHNAEILFLGTESGEWVRGYEGVSKMIRHDWVDWDNLRLDLNDCQIFASGDVAWLAAHGTVYSVDAKRPIRFTATLHRTNSKWKFRQMQFQWEDRHAALRDFVQPANYSHLHWN
jgi:ketosteroid isomerase-like protein